jgi:hypothetical protein
VGLGLDEIADLLAFDHLLGVLAVHVFPRQFEQRLVVFGLKALAAGEPFPPCSTRPGASPKRSPPRTFYPRWAALPCGALKVSGQAPAGGRGSVWLQCGETVGDAVSFSADRLISEVVSSREESIMGKSTRSRRSRGPINTGSLAGPLGARSAFSILTFWSVAAS